MGFSAAALSEGWPLAAVNPAAAKKERLDKNEADAGLTADFISGYMREVNLQPEWASRRAVSVLGRWEAMEFRNPFDQEIEFVATADSR